MSEPKFTGVRKDLECPDCTPKQPTLRVFLVFHSTSRYGPFYGCPNYPACDVAMGAHPDGSPLGVPANKETRRHRQIAHEWFDVLWKGKGGLMKRGSAYSWMQQAMGMTPEQAHIGNFDIPTCQRLVELVKQRLQKGTEG